ncbi:RNA-binding domain-containing protein [Rhizodiscina lignyota]|uniref:RNA-binding domain-containing protein n=1 Tax=Rhizodiscina lignyota TaxID=1504668 RepID=A0A9P4IRB9_9PEZI|nr:RNA-binding domain-containing protein [Rhizodiscina lignyota]
MSEGATDTSDVPKDTINALDKNVKPAENPSEELDQPSEQRRSVFVRSLPQETTNEALAEHFSQSYPIKHAFAVLDRPTKKCKGYGFVTFTEAEDAQQACREFDRSEFLGKTIRVELAQPRHRDEEAGKTGDPDHTAARSSGEHKGREEQQPPRLIVRNLPWSIKEPEQLVNLFRSYGKIKHAAVPKKRSGEMIGFGIVLIRGRKNAEKAIAGINGKEVDGRTLAVDWAVDRDTWEKTKGAEVADEDEPAEQEAAKDGLEQDEAMSDAEEELMDVDDLENVSADGAVSADEDADLEEADDALSEEEDDQEDTGDGTTLFIRNLPFVCTDEDLYDHFRQFGPLRYARVVLDPNTERSRGTGFVCFFNKEDCETCLKGAPRGLAVPAHKQTEAQAKSTSVLQDENLDPSGRYTLEGRVLQITQAVGKSEASRLTEEGSQRRNARDNDKRRLFLLSEGTIQQSSPLYQKLSPSEIAMREASVKQRRTLIQSNPSLHLSFTRLSIRNIPRSITSKDLKALARDAVVGFAKDVKAGVRQPLSKEELYRDFEKMKEADKDRRVKSKGIVKQAKVVFEGREGTKVKEVDGAGRSRGYGFIEYYTHRSALMGLRWLNGHAVGKNGAKRSASITPDEAQDRKKRLIVEFAIENAQVVGRRKEKEAKAQGNGSEVGNREKKDNRVPIKKQRSGKRKRSGKDDTSVDEQQSSSHKDTASETKDDKLAKRNRIIAKKRAMRRFSNEQDWRIKSSTSTLTSQYGHSNQSRTGLFELFVGARRYQQKTASAHLHQSS